MTCSELVAMLTEQPDYLDVEVGGYPVETARRICGDHGAVIKLSATTLHGDSSSISNPPETVDEWTAKKLEERGLSIAQIEPQPCTRSEEIDIEASVPDLIEQLSAWTGIKGAKLNWTAQVLYSDEEAEVEHCITWDGLESPDEIARRLIREYDREKHERSRLKELKAKYEGGE